MQNTDQLADEISQNGFARVEKVVEPSQISELISTIEKIRERDSDNCSAGVRHLLKRSAVVRKFASSAPLMEIAAKVLGRQATPVKAILFDKTPEANWYVTWHQDLTIAVKHKIEVDGFGPWSVKDGIPHVQPPANVLDNIVSLRIHLDDCPPENGAIKFIAGTHKVGILDSAQIGKHRDNQDHICCPANSGDIIVMRPLILHSSSQSTKVDHRRVLHIEFVGADLPGGLVWAESSSVDS
jgi:ectoine hydroxylase-related dioxygenase (phytanoyl-CoA dioxygenase family)